MQENGKTPPMARTLVKRLLAVVLLVAGDVAALVISFLMAYYVRAGLLVDVIPLFSPMLHGLEVYSGSIGILFLWLLLFAYEGVYPSVGMSFWEETKAVLKGNTLAFLIVIVLTFITRTSFQFSRPVILMAFLLSVVLLPVGRRVVRTVARRAGLWGKEVVLLGSGAALAQLRCNLDRHPDWALNPIGVITPEGEADPGGLPVLGTIADLGKIGTQAGEVIVAMPGLAPRELVAVVEGSARIAPVVKVVPDLYGLASVGVRTHDLDGLLLLEMQDRLMLRRNRIMKRIFDTACALVGLILLSPLFAILAVLIRLDSSGKVFFGHSRVGREGKQFRCYKFRTMVSNAQAVLEDLLASDPKARAEWEREFKLKDDPRITRIGNFLRRTSLDELPQLFNVILGEMSLVGPRPIVADEVEKYGDKSRYFFKVTPGITGLWQVSGRNDIDYDERVLLDEYYAKNWSLWLDIEILIRTFGAVLKREGAY